MFDSVLLLLALFTSSSLSQNTVPVDSSKLSFVNRNQRGIRVAIRTNKKQYDHGEAVLVYSFLENLLERPFYVGKTFSSLLSTELHDFDLTITDSRGRSVSIGRTAAAWIWKPNTSIKDKIAQAYVELEPGMIYGIRESLDLRLKRGQYKLSVVYRENEAVYWTSDEIRGLSNEVWTRTIKSNTIMISAR